MEPTHDAAHAEPDDTEGPRERLSRVGAEHLTDAELLALLLGTGTRGERVTALNAPAITALEKLD